MIKIYQKSSSNQSAERVTSWFKKRNIPYVVISGSVAKFSDKSILV
ncbi:hypothetical protein [Lactococcus lactis]|nr:hypothetical protein [Lactococcus lactis]